MSIDGRVPATSRLSADAANPASLLIRLILPEGLPGEPQQPVGLPHGPALQPAPLSTLNRLCHKAGNRWIAIGRHESVAAGGIGAIAPSEMGQSAMGRRHRLPHQLAALVLGLILLSSLAMSFSSGASYSRQNREFAGAAPSARFPLGTDELGRDRLTRLLYASRISLLLAAAAAALSITVAFAAGGIAGYFGGWCDRSIVRALDLMLSLPWLFLLLAVRALLPLNVSPFCSLLVTYGLLAALGWAAPARIVRAGVRNFSDSDFVLQARAEGCSELRVLLRHVLPNLKPVLLAQFWTAIPVFILAEANLGFLGLSAGEPFPTWGTLLRELQSPLGLRPEAFAPAVAIAISLFCFKLVTPWGDSRV